MSHYYFFYPFNLFFLSSFILIRRFKYFAYVSSLKTMSSIYLSCLVNWKTICWPKINGGLGVLNLQRQNQVLLIKWLRLIYHNQDSILSFFLWGNYRLPTIGSDLQHEYWALLLSFFMRDIFSLYSILNVSTLLPRGGLLQWRWTPSCVFACKSTYNLITNPEECNDFAKILWKSKTPLKNKIFMWILIQDKLLTGQNLEKQ